MIFGLSANIKQSTQVGFEMSAIFMSVFLGNSANTEKN